MHEKHSKSPCLLTNDEFCTYWFSSNGTPPLFQIAGSASDEYYKHKFRVRLIDMKMCVKLRMVKALSLLLGKRKHRKENVIDCYVAEMKLTLFYLPSLNNTKQLNHTAIVHLVKTKTY